MDGQLTIAQVERFTELLQKGQVLPLRVCRQRLAGLIRTVRVSSKKEAQQIQRYWRDKYSDHRVWWNWVGKR